jgi:hypothetical protein
MAECAVAMHAVHTRTWHSYAQRVAAVNLYQLCRHLLCPLSCAGTIAASNCNAQLPILVWGCCRCWCRHNPCLCGSLPSWLSGTVMSTNTSLGSSCGGALPDCNQPASFGTEWYSDVPGLLLLKGAAVGASVFASWDDTVSPPCASNDAGANGTGTCIHCDWAFSDSLCGTTRPSDGAVLCPWRFVACRNRRVVSIAIDAPVSCSCCRLCCFELAVNTLHAIEW